MADFTNTAKVLQDWINDVLNDARTNLRNDRTNNTNALETSLGQNFNQSVKINQNLIIGQIDALDYWGAVDEGRKPGKQPPIKDILRWVQTKLPRDPSISDSSLAYLIARKIGKEGTVGTGFMSKVLTQQRIDELENLVADAMVLDFEAQIDELEL